MKLFGKVFLLLSYSTYVLGTPALDLNSLRFNVPADGWKYAREHQLSGRYFRISKLSGGEVSPLLLNVFKDKDLKSLFFQIVGEVEVNNEPVCESFNYERESSSFDGIVFCLHGSCFNLYQQADKEKYFSNTKGDASFLLRDALLVKKCKVNLDYAVKFYWAQDKNADSIYDHLTTKVDGLKGQNFYIKAKKVDIEKGVATIEVNGSPAYVDIRSCKESPSSCEEVNLEKSDYDKDLERLASHQAKKDFKYFNLLRDNLLPCVKKKDFECVKSYFPQKEDEEVLVEKFYGYEYQSLPVNEETLSELEACLEYSSILPHLMASRGNNKVCVFRERLGFDYGEKEKFSERRVLLSITYPEAVRIGNLMQEIYLKK